MILLFDCKGFAGIFFQTFSPPPSSPPPKKENPQESRLARRLGLLRPNEFFHKWLPYSEEGDGIVYIFQFFNFIFNFFIFLMGDPGGSGVSSREFRGAPGSSWEFWGVRVGGSWGSGMAPGFTDTPRIITFPWLFNPRRHEGEEGGQSYPPSIFLALNFCSLTNYQNLWHNCSFFVKTSFDFN